MNTTKYKDILLLKHGRKRRRRRRRKRKRVGEENEASWPAPSVRGH